MFTNLFDFSDYIWLGNILLFLPLLWKLFLLLPLPLKISPLERHKTSKPLWSNWKNRIKLSHMVKTNQKTSIKKWVNNPKKCINCLLFSLFDYKAPLIGSHFVGHIEFNKKKHFFEILTICLRLQPFRIYMVLRCFRNF